MYTNFDEMPITLSVEQAAEALSISAVSLYKIIKKDSTFPAIKMGRRIVIPKENLKKWIDKKVNS
ncbi:MAG: helix-turn-helix domain-containing protein [Eubacterium sp.]|nr:helix-turn-helix domain-containing protein [Eubacterium sp.]MBQ9229154.1 helix-turn-helix domain-containing protein [Eubacterium sp.]